MPAECSANRCRMALPMSRRLLRRLALALIAFLAFAQASVALAACTMDRGQMGPATVHTHDGMAGDEDCCTVDSVPSAQPQVANDCFAHCTADLQVTGFPVVLVHAPALTPVLLLPRLESGPPGRAILEAQPPPTITSRILLHSFLI